MNPTTSSPQQQIPLMEDVFGSGVLGHLSSVGNESDDLRELVHRELFRPVWDKAVMQPLGMRLDVEPYRWASWHTYETLFIFIF